MRAAAAALAVATAMVVAVCADRGLAAAQQTVQIVGPITPCGSGVCYQYQPALVSVSSGDTVTWTNMTVAPNGHTVTLCDKNNCKGQGRGSGTDALDSGSQLSAQNESYSHTFTGAGTYFYYCTVHGYDVMHAEVDVAIRTLQPGTPGSTPTPAPTPTPPPAPTPSPTPSPTDTPSPSASTSPTPSASDTAGPGLGAAPGRSGGGFPLVAVVLVVLLLIAAGSAAGAIWLRRSG